MRDNRLARAIGQYIGEMKAKGLCKSYTDRSHNILVGFVEFCVSKGKTSPSSVDVITLRDYLSGFADNSASYQGFVYAIVKCFLRYAGNPLGWKFRYRIVGRGRQVRWLSAEEVDQILSTELTPMEAVAITCHFLAGMRRCEVRRLLIWDIQEGLRTGQMTVTGKNAKQRPICASRHEVGVPSVLADDGRSSEGEGRPVGRHTIYLHDSEDKPSVGRDVQKPRWKADIPANPQTPRESPGGRERDRRPLRRSYYTEVLECQYGADEGRCGVVSSEGPRTDCITASRLDDRNNTFHSPTYWIRLPSYSNPMERYAKYIRQLSGRSGGVA